MWDTDLREMIRDALTNSVQNGTDWDGMSTRDIVEDIVQYDSRFEHFYDDMDRAHEACGSYVAEWLKENGFQVQAYDKRHV